MNTLSTRIEEIFTSLPSDETIYISFDVFDTTLLRENLDQFTQWRVLGEYFALRRLISELLARTIAKIYTHKEITSADIYRWLPEFDLDKEIDLEMNNIYVNPEVIRVLDKFKSNSQVKIFFISDTHFSDGDLTKLLEKVGIYKHDIFTSSSNGKSKSSEIYQIIAKKMKIDPKNWIHIGDKRFADYTAAKEFGINALFYPQPRTLLCASGLFSKKAYKNLLRHGKRGRKTITTISRLILSSNMTTETSLPALLGYVIMSPVSRSIAFSIDSLRESGRCDQIWYSSRDGWIPHAFAASDRFIETKYVRYFKTSRAMLSDPKYFEYVVRQVSQNSKIALFDVGWKGTTQAHLSKISPNVQWVGVYWALKRRKKLNQHSLSRNTFRNRLSYNLSRGFIETVFCAPTRSYIGFDNAGNPLESVSKQDALEIFQAKLLEGVDLFLQSSVTLCFDLWQSDLILGLLCKMPSRMIVEESLPLLFEVSENKLVPLVQSSWSDLFSKHDVIWFGGSVRSVTTFKKPFFLVSLSIKTLVLQILYLLKK